MEDPPPEEHWTPTREVPFTSEWSLEDIASLIRDLEDSEAWQSDLQSPRRCPELSIDGDPGFLTDEQREDAPSCQPPQRREHREVSIHGTPGLETNAGVTRVPSVIGPIDCITLRPREAAVILIGMRLGLDWLRKLHERFAATRLSLDGNGEPAAMGKDSVPRTRETNNMLHPTKLPSATERTMALAPQTRPLIPQEQEMSPVTASRISQLLPSSPPLAPNEESAPFSCRTMQPSVRATVEDLMLERCKWYEEYGLSQIRRPTWELFLECVMFAIAIVPKIEKPPAINFLLKQEEYAKDATLKTMQEEDSFPAAVRIMTHRVLRSDIEPSWEQEVVDGLSVQINMFRRQVGWRVNLPGSVILYGGPGAVNVLRQEYPVFLSHL